jgi:hypothetical protein
MAVVDSNFKDTGLKEKVINNPQAVLLYFNSLYFTL